MAGPKSPLGTFHSCGIKADSTLWCWGADKSGELGIGGRKNETTPQQLGDRADWRFVTSGHNLGCAIPADGTLWCWGRGDHGQVGYGGTGIVRKPVQIGDATNWVSVDGSDGGKEYTADSHACGLRSDHTVWCWGQNQEGQIGDGTGTDALTPVQVARDHWTQVSAGDDQTCALQQNRTIWCWGNTFAKGVVVNTHVPLKVDKGHTWASISVGGAHNCATQVDGTLWCWGNNFDGELGDGTRVNHFAPEQVGQASDWVQVVAGLSDSCGLKTDGTAWCWGDGSRGQIGDGHLRHWTRPEQVQGGPGSWATAPSIRYKHACALGTDGSAWCWGYNDHGQLGNGTFNETDLPTQVVSS